MSRAMRFVLLVGVVSLFADWTYEGARSIVGQYLAELGAGPFAIAAVTGFGELVGYALRLVSGRLADRGGRYWPVAILGYVVQMSAVPLLSLAGGWPGAALLVVLERVGKATRNPPRDAMLSRAGEGIGYGWVFGVHEALDQSGATVGPLAVALGMIVWHGSYRRVFLGLAVPAALALVSLVVARSQFPQPGALGRQEAPAAALEHSRFPRSFWRYLVPWALVGAGLADFPLIAYHLEASRVTAAPLIPVFYALAMAVGGLGSVLFGRWYDRAGFVVPAVVALIGAAYGPLVFLGGFLGGLVGSAVWGLASTVIVALSPAVLAPLIPPEHRGSAYGVFSGLYGLAWFLGSLILGALYTVSRDGLAVFTVAALLLAAVLFLAVGRTAQATGAKTA